LSERNDIISYYICSACSRRSPLITAVILLRIIFYPEICTKVNAGWDRFFFAGNFRKQFLK